IAVVIGNEGDLAPVHAALIVDHLEIGGHRYQNGAGARERAAIGAGVADLDRAVGDPGAVLLGGSRRAGDQYWAAKGQRCRSGAENRATREKTDRPAKSGTPAEPAHLTLPDPLYCETIAVGGVV